MSMTSTCDIRKCCREIKVNAEIYQVRECEDLLRYHFSPVDL